MSSDNGRLPTNENGKQYRWLGLTLDATDDQARAAFRRRFGYQAAEVHRGAVIVYAGPIGGDYERMGRSDGESVGRTP